MQIGVNTKSWAKNKRSKKYTVTRDFRKATSNGATLRRMENSRNSWSNWGRHRRVQIECNGGINPIEKYLNIINPNDNDIESNLNDILNNTNPTMIKYKKCNYNAEDRWYQISNKWIIYYRYSSDQQYEEYQYNLKKAKAMKDHNKKCVKAKKLPKVKENILNYKKQRLLDKNNKSQPYILYDLGKNKWMNAFTWSGWNGYKLYIAVHDDEKQQILKTDKLKWEYIGCFKGWDKVKINHNVYCDINDNGSMKKYFSQNGKLCRWIKLISSDNDDKLRGPHSSKIYGVEVDDYSRPIIPYNGVKKNDDDDENTDDGTKTDYDYRLDKDFQIGPNMDDEEIYKGRGCKVIIKQKRKNKTFGRSRIDGVVYYNWNKRELPSKRQLNRRYMECIKQLHKKRDVNDWNINGIPFW